jgi:hypothetical protein
MFYQSKKGLEAVHNHPRIHPARKREAPCRVDKARQEQCVLGGADAAEEQTGRVAAETAGGCARENIRSKPRELVELEEVIHEFDKFTDDESGIVVAFRDSSPILLPTSVREALRPFRTGQLVAIFKVNDDCIKVRLE